MRRALRRFLGFEEANRLYTSLHSTAEDRPMPERLLDQLAITYRVGELDLEKIPRAGPVIVVANHPFGILEGAVLATVLARVRSDVRFLANEILAFVPEIQELLIPVDALAENGAAR